ncbi:conserved exported hypothetical protein [Methylocella tundrae]|uniref:Cytochrome c domain-containing protein n=1 Tax=Methylocella tundrae TaxID=227605 RepID=A0A8B6M3C0_METTU|nr:hypothetical protein [Methylocella tundrae]VTZ26676.1 conserved exported hypothetical protein [Methylocella tundrae]VTZ49541.1 conserved exported hypothetical protein [Methylocella tundrae]
MTRLTFASVLFFAFVIAFMSMEPSQREAALGVSSAKAQIVPQLNPCAAPNAINPTDAAETAWQLWVAATCPVNTRQYPFVVWEDWIEQAQMYPANPAAGLEVPNAKAAGPNATHLLHGSPLATLKKPNSIKLVPGLLGGADQSCNKASTPPPGQPNLVICEEVRLNGAVEDYIAGTKLWKRGGQTKAAANGTDIQFSPPSVEIKADWIQLSSIGLDCSTLPAKFFQKIHVETINGNCFALAGMHLMSKLQNKWIWATFEPQSPITNPYRCQVLGCTDDFGSTPTVTHGADTSLTPGLTALMTAANLAPEFFNYRLDGVQIGYFKPQLLGNSIIEGENAGVPLTQASCITCHSVSSIKNDGTDGITLLTSNPVGAPPALPSDAWIRRDFIWSLSEACFNSPLQACTQQ